MALVVYALALGVLSIKNVIIKARLRRIHGSVEYVDLMRVGMQNFSARKMRLFLGNIIIVRMRENYYVLVKMVKKEI